MLEITNLSLSYGPVRALDDVSLSVEEGGVVALLGMNGAGKTSLLACISGLCRHRGTVRFMGRDLAGLGPAGRVRLGLVQVPEGRQVFGPMSVEENLLLGGHVRLKAGEKAEVARDLDRLLTDFPELADKRARPAGTLSGGEQQMLALARGLMARPRLLMLDEPTLGLAPQVASRVLATVRELPERGATVLLVEQNALGALAVSGGGHILTNGRVRFSGAPSDILADGQLREAFLGSAAATRNRVKEDTA